MDDIWTLIKEGRLGAAGAALRDHLQQHPNDTEARDALRDLETGVYSRLLALE